MEQNVTQTFWIISICLLSNPAPKVFPSQSRYAAAAAKLLHSCPTLCDPIDGSPPGFSFPGILQARILEWVAISFSIRHHTELMHNKFLVCLMKESEVSQLCPSLCDAMDCSLPGFSVHAFSRQEYWSGLPLPFPGDLPDPGIKLGSPALKADDCLMKVRYLNIISW